MDTGQNRQSEVAEMKAAGTYAIRHAESGRRYVGQTLDLAARFRYHRSRLNCGRHHNIALQRDWQRDGADAFVFEIVNRFRTETEIDRRHCAERLLIAATDPALSYNFLSADVTRRDGAGMILKPRVLKLNAGHWQAFDELGGMAWLRKLIDRAKPPKPP